MTCMSMYYNASLSSFLALVSCLSSSLAHVLPLPLLFDHLALRSVLVVNEISLSVLKFLQLILLFLLPLFILSPPNNSPSFHLHGDTSIPSCAVAPLIVHYLFLLQPCISTCLITCAGEEDEGEVERKAWPTFA